MARDQDMPRERRGGAVWFWTPVIIIVLTGAGLSLAAYLHEPTLTAAEAVALGFGGLSALIAALTVGLFSVFTGLPAAVAGLAVAGGAIVVTLFLVASPAIAIILFILLLRRSKPERTSAGIE